MATTCEVRHRGYSMKSPHEGDYTSITDDIYFYHTEVVVRHGGYSIRASYQEPFRYNKPIQDGGDADAPLWLNRLSVTY